ncbi:MAG: hypothetical protein JST39_20010 [Bacteroidetes bacterium]|nr:hypothetical protein [Bacteroidota bacterium]
MRLFSRKGFAIACYIIACVSLVLFIAFIVSIFLSDNLDNSGMGIFILVPPFGMCVLLLVMSHLELFHYQKKNIKSKRAVYVIMGLLAAPMLLAGLFLLWMYIDSLFR